MKDNKMQKFYLLSIKDTENILETDLDIGLSNTDAEKRLKENGKNIIVSGKKHGIIYKFFSQFKDLMIIILLISALLSFAIGLINGGEIKDAFIILFIVIVNGIIGTVQEYKAEKAIDALKKLTSQTAKVLRNGKIQTIDASLVALGDVIILKAGDICPADIRITESVELYIEESALTGEADAVHKDENYIGKENEPLSHHRNIVFSGSNVYSGHAKGIVVNVGMDTEFGKIAKMLKTEESPETPLSRKLNYTSKILAIIITIIAAIIFILGLMRGENTLNMLMISISLAVAAIPEGLAAVVSIVLSLGVKRMAKKSAIVRKPLAVETLGSTTVICSDKTGTLTENKMTVTKVCDHKTFLEENSEKRRFIISLGALCNDSEVNSKGKVSGTPTEKAIMEAYIKEGGAIKENLPRIGEIPFSSKRKMMTTVHKMGEKYLVIAKGTPKVILDKCSFYLKEGKNLILTESVKASLNALNSNMEASALRVLAVAKKECDDINIPDDEIEMNFTFCGFIGIEDMPRKEAEKAVKEAIKAGIKPVMITGDQVGTAKAIASKLVIYNEKSGHKIMKGSELNKFTAESLAKIIEPYRVFASVSPEDKVKIVKAYRLKGHIAAMTGDGVNDAPALKAADIGCAMGKNGTEVAKGAADMVLTDDNFATIVEAIKEGRNIFLNIRKTIHFLISSNIGEVLLIFASFLLNLPTPLLPSQLLWVNLITDSFPALAIGSSRSEDNIMDAEFLNDNKDVLSKSSWVSLIIEGAFIGSLSLLAFIIGRVFFDADIYNPIIGRTMAFAVICLSQLVHSFNVISTKSIFSKNRKDNKLLRRCNLFCTILMIIIISVPSLASIFNSVPLNFKEWGIVMILSLCPILVSEIEKRIKR